MQRIVDRFNLSKWLGQEEARLKLVQAGYRGQAPYITFLFFRLVMPAVMLAGTLTYLFLVLELKQPPLLKFAGGLFAAYFGMHVPILFLKNRIQNRQLQIRRAFPDALDLLLICVESGMSIEACVQEGERGDRLAVDRARRGVDADHRGVVVFAGSADGL